MYLEEGNSFLSQISLLIELNDDIQGELIVGSISPKIETCRAHVSLLPKFSEFSHF